MIVLMNECPKFCPKCGLDSSRYFAHENGRQDFFAGAAHTCKCGTHYAYVAGKDLLAVAAEHGDMGRYVTEDMI